ncbi:MAG: SDR family oxidoreductase [Cyclobacteriaceae bacterium]|nr:SDR family oxidoreductase [Cyclobacteriaceae bacterium]
MGRAADPEEMTGLAVFLASDASSYVTASVFTIDGGYLVS